MVKSFIRAGLVSGIALALVACGGQTVTPAAIAPTAVPVLVPTSAPTTAPTSAPTSAPTTAPTSAPTSAPTTAPTSASTTSPAGVVLELPPITTSAEAAAILANTLERTRALTTYTAEFEVVATGLSLGLPPDAVAELAPDGELVVLDGSLAVSGEDSETTQAGMMSAMLGLDPEVGMTTRTVGGETYLRGPAPMLGAPEDAWYIQSEEASFSATIDVMRLLESLGSDEADFAEYMQVGGGSVNGVSCSIFMADEASTERFMMNSGGMMPSADEFEGTTRLTVMACEDGFVYDVELSMHGVSKLTGEQVSFSTELEMLDHNGDVAIETPAAALPLEAPAMP